MDRFPYLTNEMARYIAESRDEDEAFNRIVEVKDALVDHDIAIQVKNHHKKVELAKRNIVTQVAKVNRAEVFRQEILAQREKNKKAEAFRNKIRQQLKTNERRSANLNK